MKLKICEVITLSFTEKKLSSQEIQKMSEIFIHSAPFIVNLWDNKKNLLTTSKQAITIFDLENMQQYIDHFAELSPEFQPCGTPSMEKAFLVLDEAFEHGIAKFEWMHQKLNGEQLPMEITLVRIKHQNEYMVIAYSTDLRPIKEAMKKEQASYNMTRMFLDSAPFFIETWDSELNLLECNLTAAKLFGLTDAKEYIRIFKDFVPEYQPCGTLSSEKLPYLIKETIRKISLLPVSKL